MVDKDSLKKEIEGYCKSFAAAVRGDIKELIDGLFYFFQYSCLFFNKLSRKYEMILELKGMNCCSEPVVKFQWIVDVILMTVYCCSIILDLFFYEKSFLHMNLLIFFLQNSWNWNYSGIIYCFIEIVGANIGKVKNQYITTKIYN